MGDAPGNAGTGSSDAEVFRSIYPLLRRFAAVTASQDVDPDDLVQEALAATLARGPLSGLDHPAAYLRRCIINLESNHRRSRSRARTRERLSGIPAIEHPIYPSDLDDLAALEPRQRAILYLFEVEGWPFARIAELLDEDEATVRRRATTARRQLKLSIEEGTSR